MYESPVLATVYHPATPEPVDAEEHEDLRIVPPTRHQYVYGSMNGHNVVMGCLPATQTGKGGAASVASEMLTHFPCLRFGLLVGVAGGVTGKKGKIRLGDVVSMMLTRP